MLRWWHGWTPLILLPTAVLLLTPADWPRWLFMWVLVFAIYCGCKWLTWRRSVFCRPHTPCAEFRTRSVRPAIWMQAGYLLAWPGMDAPNFFNLNGVAAVRRPRWREWSFALAKPVFGLVLLFGVAPSLQDRHLHPYFVGWLVMISVVLVVHFGIFHLLSCSWRSVGVAAVPLMDRPLAATSVSDFWGKCWNLAFRDLTHRFLFRPFTRRIGPRPALFLGFVCSGLVHEVAITVPAGGGYGGPSLFFILQGLGIFVERSAFGRRLGLGTGLRGWLFTMAVLLGPVYLLSPPSFVEGIMVPFMLFLVGQRG